MKNLNLPKWVKEAPQTFKCYLSAKAFNSINNDLRWYFNKWVMTTDEFTVWMSAPMDVTRDAIYESCVRVATDNFWNILHCNKSELAKKIGLPVLTAHTLDYAGVGHILAKHLMDAIRRGDIIVQVKYKWCIGKYVFLPEIQLVQDGYPTRLDQNIDRAAKVTRTYHNIKDTRNRTAFVDLIFKHRDYYYGPYTSADEEREYTVPKYAVKFSEKK